MSKLKKAAFKTIKRIAILAPVILLGVFFASCNSDNHGPNVNYMITRIDSVDVPDTILPDESYKFDINYEKPNDCFEFNGFNTNRDPENDEYTIAAVGTLYDMDSCQNYTTPKIKTAQLNFNSHAQDSSYVFKFLKDADSLGKPVYITKKVIVTHEN